MTRREKNVWNDAIEAAIRRLIEKGLVVTGGIEELERLKIRKTEFKRQERRT